MTEYPARPNFSTPTPTERNRLFGTFQFQNKGDGTIRILGGWESQNIVRVEVPQLIGVEGAPKTGIVLFHKKGAAQLQAFFQAVEDEGLKHLILSWAGSFYPRYIRGSRTALSNHSWGTAFDINAAWNPLNKQPAAVGQKGSVLKLVPIANDFGFFWGGHYRTRLDGMHFELAVLNRFRKTFVIENTEQVSAIEPIEPAISETSPKPSDTVQSPDEKFTEPLILEAKPSPAMTDCFKTEALEPVIGSVRRGMEVYETAIKVTSGKSRSFIIQVCGLILSALVALAGFVKDNWKLIAVGAAAFVFLCLVIITVFTVINALKMRYAADPDKNNVE